MVRKWYSNFFRPSNPPTENPLNTDEGLHLEQPPPQSENVPNPSVWQFWRHPPTDWLNRLVKHNQPRSHFWSNLQKSYNPFTALRIRVNMSRAAPPGSRKISFNVSEQYDIQDVVGEGAYGVVW